MPESRDVALSHVASEDDIVQLLSETVLRHSSSTSHLRHGDSLLVYTLRNETWLALMSI